MPVRPRAFPLPLGSSGFSPLSGFAAALLPQYARTTLPAPQDRLFGRATPWLTFDGLAFCAPVVWGSLQGTIPTDAIQTHSQYRQFARAGVSSGQSRHSVSSYPIVGVRCCFGRPVRRWFRPILSLVGVSCCFWTSRLAAVRSYYIVGSREVLLPPQFIWAKITAFDF